MAIKRNLLTRVAFAMSCGLWALLLPAPAEPALWAQTAPAASSANTNDPSRLRQALVQQLKGRINQLLNQYCQQACSLIDVKIRTESPVAEVNDFDTGDVLGDQLSQHLLVKHITAEVQIDDRITSLNRSRLLTILQSNLQSFSPSAEVLWRPITVPQIGEAVKEEDLKHLLQQRVSSAIEKVIDTYCPEDCVLAQVAIGGRLITADEAHNYQARELIRDKGSEAILKVERIDIEVSMNSVLSTTLRHKITNIMKAKTRFASPLTLNVQTATFPESYISRREKTADPYGLDKLRETLKIFRELSAAKELVTGAAAQLTTLQPKPISRQIETKAAAAPKAAVRAPAPPPNGQEWIFYLSGLLIVVGLAITLMLRFATASRDAKFMMEAAQSSSSSPEIGRSLSTNAAAPSDVQTAARLQIAQRMKCQELKDELTRVLVDNPILAKETFSRLLQEEGIEITAQYVHIFGHLIVFELLSDPSLQRELYNLSEYYHKSSFNFSTGEELKLLQTLKTRVTANEIRIMTRMRLHHFDFLAKLCNAQLYNLIIGESPQVQCIVLTQLDYKRRRALFDMYQGQAKVDLMRELCRIDAIPKEYLFNVATALQRKATKRPELDAEHIRSSDILLDLVEKSALAEQKALIQDLMETNPETAHSLKLKLVTIEAMPYLKDNQLLDIILGMERADLLTFLAGTREYIRGLILTKVPEDLAESWIEALANMTTLDEQNYRRIEMQTIARIRTLANNGAINILDINELIFDAAGFNDEAFEDDTDLMSVDGSSNMVA